MRGCDATGSAISVFQGRVSNDVIVVLRCELRWGSDMELLWVVQSIPGKGTAQTLDSLVGAGWSKKHWL